MGLLENYTSVQCLLCEPGKEQSIVQAVQKYEWAHAIFAQRVRFIKKEKEWKQVMFPLLPGYVFVYQNRANVNEIDYRQMPYVLQPLKYADGSTQLKGNDLVFSDWLWRMKGEIGVVKTIRVGDRLEIADGMLREMNGQIIHINRRQRKIYVSLDSMSFPIRTWLAYEQPLTSDKVSFKS